MPARAIWKGEIVFDDFRLPVKLYSAVEDRAIHFHLLHDQDLVRVRQRMVNPETNETVPSERIRKGFEVARGELVILDDDDLAKLEPPASRDIEISQFVPASAINHQWYDRPYWLGPDRDAPSYFALAESLGGDVEGVARWVMRKKEYVGALRVEQGYLALVTLRRVEEIIPASQLEPPEGRALEKQERQLAGQLIKALAAKFDPAEFHDEYRQRVRELIETKRKGGTVEVEEIEPQPKRKSLAESLRASLQAMS